VQKFTTQNEFLNALSTHWQSQPSTTAAHTTDAAILDALRAGVQQADTDVRQEEQSRDGALGLRIGGWIIRPEDLPVLDAISVGAAAAAAAFGPGGMTAVAVVAAVSGFASLCWKAWRKGASLSPDEVAVLGFLKLHGPMALEDLKKMAAAQLDGFSEDRVELSLKSLRDVELLNGDLVDLVRIDESGRWRARPI